MTPKEVHEKLGGDVGSKVTLSIRRGGQGPTQDVMVERGPFKDEGKAPK
jgi:hypothetical protein